MQNANGLKSLDRLIFGFMLLFLISLTNSIFFNQLGYFGALILILIRFARTRENPFYKTGLELPFILFILVELISALLSVNQAQAFHNLLKRFLLLPIVYAVAATADEPEKAKTFFRFYISAAVITVLAYIVFAYEHFISQLYRLESRGPSPFQYVMTAGGLMSFTVIFLFAFLLDYKTETKYKALIFFGFIASSVALFASYTRAAWIGAAAGLAVVVLIKRKWLLIPLTILVVAAFFYPQNVSRVFEFQLEGNKISGKAYVETPGRAMGLLAEGDTLFVADYENGLILIADRKIVDNFRTTAPVTGIKKWTSEIYFVFLVDSRIQLLKKDNGKLALVEEFTSPGKTTGYKISSSAVYIADEDSGLTVYKSPGNLKDFGRFPALNNFRGFDADSDFAAGYRFTTGSLLLYKLHEAMPAGQTDSLKINSGKAFLWLNNRKLYAQFDDRFVIYSIENGKLVAVAEEPVKGIMKIEFTNGAGYTLAADSKFYLFEPEKNGSRFIQIEGLNFAPADFALSGNAIYFSFNKRNRVASIFDPYHDTNLERMGQWRTGFKIFKDHPLFGVGDIDLKDVYAKYKDYYLKENFGHLHNNYVHFIVILGAVGFVVVIFLLVKVFLTNLRIYRLLKEVPFAGSYSLGALAAFIGFLVSGLAEWNFGDHEIITMVWFTVGLNIAFYKNYKLKKDETGGAN